MCISKRIKDRRQELGISVEELANRIDKNKATIYRYENGDIGKVPYDILGPLSEALDVSIAYLVGAVTQSTSGDTQSELTNKEELLLKVYNELNDFGKKEAIKRVSELTEIDKYTKTTTLAAHNDDNSQEQIELMMKDFEEMSDWED